MNSPYRPYIAGAAIAASLICGLLFMILAVRPGSAARAAAVELDAAEQDDFIIMVAEAYAGDGNMHLAEDRLARLHDSNAPARVEKLALSYAPQADLAAAYLARLAVAMGSTRSALAALAVTPVPPPTELPPALAALAGQDIPTPAVTTAKSASTAAVSLKTSTLVPTSIPTKAPTRPPAPPPPAPPPPATEFYPDRSRWPSSVYFTPANVARGQGYWHLKKAVYCDAFDNSDPRKRDFGCDEMPGGPAGTNIYVMTGGAGIDVIQPDGTNVGGDRNIVGDKKAPNDMCNCTYSFESSNVKVSVAGAASDAIGGFCLCSVNFGWGSRAHVRYFLYYEYITR